MKAVYICEFGGSENLKLRDVGDLPEPAESQVLVKVKAAALNRADILQRKGFYPAPKGFPERIPGLEFAGEIAAVGENVVDFRVGESVFGITSGGAQAEFVLTESSLLAKIPEKLGFVEAAAIPEAFITASDAIFGQADLKTGESLLIHAVGSGVGLAALQLAKARNIRTFGTSRTSAKLEKCRQFGLDEGIITDDRADFEGLIKERTGGRGVDVVLDLVGGAFFKSNLESLNLKGRLVLVGLVGGRTAEIDLGLVLAKRLKIIGTVLRSRPTAEKAVATREFIDFVLPLFDAGLIEPNLDKIFPVADVRAAHDYLESNKSFGKVVLDFA